MKHGLTLVEVLIAMAIATIVGLLLFVIIVNSAGLFYTQSSKLSQGVGINDALQKVKEAIRSSSSVAPSYQDGPATYTSSSTQLILKIPSIDTSGNVIGETFDYYVFFQDQNFFTFKSFPASQSSRKASDQILSSNVDSLTFRYFDSQTPPQEVTAVSAAKVRLTIILKQKAGMSYEQSIATAEASLRND